MYISAANFKTNDAREIFGSTFSIVAVDIETGEGTEKEYAGAGEVVEVIANSTRPCDIKEIISGCESVGYLSSLPVVAQGNS
jgi:hypothetical protein